MPIKMPKNKAVLRGAKRPTEKKPPKPTRLAQERKPYAPRKTPQQRMAELSKKRGKNNEPLWDLDRDGITYSMLSKFMVCPERFRLSSVEGWSETGLQAAMEFGNAFHACLENPQHPPEKITRQYQQSRIAAKALFPNQIQEFEVLMGMVEAMVHAYRDVYHEDVDQKQFILHEEKFEIPHNIQLTVPCDCGEVCLDENSENYGRPEIHYGVTHREVKLRGKIDAVFRKKDGSLWIMETKTKSDIDVDGISRTLSQDLQTMMYVTALTHLKGETVGGVLYNVIRRPALRQGKGETLRDFIKRVKDTALEQRDRYFIRWPHTLEPGALERWQERTFNPILTQVVQWWDSIKANPFDPWGSPYHYQRPFGVYDSLASGRRGDFFELLTSGSTSGLYRRSEVFPELAD